MAANNISFKINSEYKINLPQAASRWKLYHLEHIRVSVKVDYDNNFFKGKEGQDFLPEYNNEEEKLKILKTNDLKDMNKREFINSLSHCNENEENVKMVVRCILKSLGIDYLKGIRYYYESEMILQKL